MLHPRLPRAGAALAAAVIAAIAFGAVASPAAAKRVRVVSWNVDKNSAAVTRAMTAIRSQRAVGAALQEVCQSQFDNQIQKVAGRLRWSTHFVVTRGGRDNCPVEKEAVGTVAIWTGGTTGTPSNDPLEPDPGRLPTLTCVHPPAANPIGAICSVHLATRQGDDFTADQAKAVRKKQTWDIKSHAAKYISAGKAVIVGGDFNAQPDEAAMNNMYAAPKGRGPFIAAHELAGQPPLWTAPANGGNPKRKIDYIFFSKAQMKLGAKSKLRRVKGGKYSPHSMLIANAVIN